MPKSTICQFLSATRPRTYPIAITSLGVGQSLAYRTLGGFDGHQWLMAWLIIYTALSLQILSNLANDLGDGIRGTDQHRHADSPTRLVGSGMVSSQQVWWWLMVWLFQTMFVGGLLIWLSLSNLKEILLFFGLGAASILAAVGYTMGKKPYGYQALGELSVLIFFGFVAVLGGYWLQVGKVEMHHVVIAAGVGLMSVCVLYINNLRDVASDKISGKLTLALVLGRYKIIAYFGLFGLAMFCYVWHLVVAGQTAWMLMLAVPLLVRHIYAVQKYRTHPDCLGKQLGVIVAILVLVNGLVIFI